MVMPAAAGDAVDRPTSRQVQALFDRIAPVYDQLNDQLSLGQHRVWKHMAVQWAAPQAGQVGLDLCCGSGDLARLLAAAVGASGQVYGADFSAAQLAVARDRPDSQGLPITWVEADALKLPFADQFFDVATMGYGLRNVLDISQSLREVKRVLKPEATIAILDFHRPYSAWAQQFQHWYLQAIVVPAADRLGVIADYEYIAPSLDRFPQGREQERLAIAAGFRTATHYAIAGGMMGVLVAQA